MVTPSWYGFSVKEAAVAAVLTDDPSSLTGPTYGPKFPWKGLQSFNRSTNRELKVGRGDGVPQASEAEIGDLPITLNFLWTSPEVEAIVFDLDYWETPEGKSLAMSDDSGSSLFGLWLRTNRTGTNGADLVIFFPLLSAGNQQKDAQGSEFHGNQINAQAAFTRSKFERYKNGVKGYASRAWLEQWRSSAEPLVEPGSLVAPTITTANITNHPIGNNIVLTASAALNPNTVNDETVWLREQGQTTLIAAAVALTGGTTITINPEASLTLNKTYEAIVTTFVKSANGVAFAADDITTVTTPAS